MKLNTELDRFGDMLQKTARASAYAFAVLLGFTVLLTEVLQGFLGAAYITFLASWDMFSHPLPMFLAGVLAVCFLSCILNLSETWAASGEVGGGGGGNLPKIATLHAILGLGVATYLVVKLIAWMCVNLTASGEDIVLVRVEPGDIFFAFIISSVVGAGFVMILRKPEPMLSIA